MKRLGLVVLTFATALAISPTALADDWYYTISASNFTADLTLVATPNVANGVVDPGVDTIIDVSGTFHVIGETPITFGPTAPEVANFDSNAYSLTDATDGKFLFDNLLYPGNTGNAIFDTGGFLIDISGYELNIYSGAFGTFAPPNGDFYFTDNGSYHTLVLIAGPAESLSSTPEPDSLLLFGTGVLGLGWVLFRRASKRSAVQV